MKQVVIIGFVGLLLGVALTWGFDRLLHRAGAEGPQSTAKTGAVSAAGDSTDTTEVRMAALEKQLLDVKTLLAQPQAAAARDMESRLIRLEKSVTALAKSAAAGLPEATAPAPLRGTDEPPLAAPPWMPPSPAELAAFDDEAYQRALDIQYDQEQRFADEVVDPVWSAAMADQIEETLATAAPRGMMAPAAVECRANTCRIQRDYEDAAETQRVLLDLLSSLEGEIGGANTFAAMNPDGTVNTDIYLKRSASP